MSPYLAALQTLRRCSEALAGDVSADERARLLALHTQTLRLLEQSAQRRRLSTEALAVRVAVLDRQLIDRDPGERMRITCQRLGISRSHYYALRNLTESR